MPLDNRTKPDQGPAVRGALIYSPTVWTVEEFRSLQAPAAPLDINSTLPHIMFSSFPGVTGARNSNPDSKEYSRGSPFYKIPFSAKIRKCQQNKKNLENQKEFSFPLFHHPKKSAFNILMCVYPIFFLHIYIFTHIYIYILYKSSNIIL